MILVGIDLGSRFVKLALLEGESLNFKIFDTVEFYRKYGTVEANGFNVNLGLLGIEGEVLLCATGYGRNNLKIHSARIISEIIAHAEGAKAQSGLRDFILLDLGGQDSKVIVVRDGVVRDFVANDRCAASTGRYLENMAKILGLSVEELGNYWEDPIHLSSTCAIFGESELINLISDGAKIERLAAGVNHSIVGRVKNFLLRHKQNPLILAGGVALNRAIRQILKEMGFEIVEIKYPQYNGAIGCLSALVDGKLEFDKPRAEKTIKP